MDPFYSFCSLVMIGALAWAGHLFFKPRNTHGNEGGLHILFFCGALVAIAALAGLAMAGKRLFF